MKYILKTVLALFCLENSIIIVYNIYIQYYILNIIMPLNEIILTIGCMILILILCVQIIKIE